MAVALQPRYSPRGRRLGRPPKPRVVAYRRPPLYPAQEQAIFCDARYGLVEAATKTGKTTGCLAWLFEKACLLGAPGRFFWWVAPVYKQAGIAYQRAKRYLPKGMFEARDGAQEIVLPNGATVCFKSAEKPDNLYGEDVYAAVVDEATRVREASWHALRSTLTYTKGPVRFIGNVKGRKNWMFKLARRAQAGEKNMHYAKLTAYDAVAAGVLDAEEIEDAKRTLPPAVFGELYLAEPSSDGENPFGFQALKECYQEQLAPGPVVAWGIDLGKSVSWTVMHGLNREKRVAGWKRFQMPWRETIAEIRRTVGRTAALVDSTGVGDVVVEHLQSGPLPERAPQAPPPSRNRLVQSGVFPPERPATPFDEWDKQLAELKQACPNLAGFVIGAVSRQQILEQAAIETQQRSWGIYKGLDDVAANEFESMEYVFSRTGGMRYETPEGMTDDCIFGAALALRCFQTMAVTANAGGRVISL
jgi:hypothetical protein